LLLADSATARRGKRQCQGPQCEADVRSTAPSREGGETARRLTAEMKSRADLADAFQRRYPVRNVHLSWEFGIWTVRLARKVKAGDLIMAFNVKDALTVKNAEELNVELSRNKEKLKSWMTINDGLHYRQLMLALLLLSEKAKGAASRWAEYLAVLPTTFSDVAHHSDEEAACLTAQQQAHRLKKRKIWDAVFAGLKFISRRYAPDLLPAPLLRSEVAWAVSIVSTRGFAIPGVGDGLVPWLDMCNHDPTKGLPALQVQIDQGHVKDPAFLSMLRPAVGLPDDTSASLVGEVYHALVATEDLDEGSEVFDVYAWHGVQDEMESYGYVPSSPRLVMVDALTQRVAMQPSCGMMEESTATVCFQDMNISVHYTHDDSSSGSRYLQGLACQDYLSSALRVRLQQCTGATSHTDVLPQKILRESLLATIKTYEADEKRCGGFVGGNFPMISRMRETALSGLHSVLKQLP